MKVAKLDGMVRGWFVGDFQPTAYVTQDVEVGIKRHAAGATEARHHHKVATEITVIVSGHVRMNGIDYQAGDIVTVEPNESTDFHVVTDTLTVVVKLPGATNDKYLGAS
jgi:hypothetical protein